MSHLEGLSRCIIESDPDLQTRAKRLRSKSLAMSLAIEAAVVAALLIVPLLAPSALPPVYLVTPASPYPGGTKPQPSRSHAYSQRPKWTPIFHPTVQRPVFREAGELFGEVPPVIGEATGAGGPGPGVLGGDGHGAVVNLARPQSAHPTRPLAQSEGVMAARLIRRVQPEYPRMAKLMRLSGAVELRAIIAADGSVRQLEVLSGNPILARAALAAVQQWRYEPTRLDGQPVEVETQITVTFVLN
ncbi:MAG: TonB family protein [Candidatus Acidiferrales bacterium]